MPLIPNRFLLLLILVDVTVLSDVITKDFVRVTKYCPESRSAFGEILILSERENLYPYALCKGRVYIFDQICAGVFRLRFRHSGDPVGDCISTLPTGEDHYAVQVKLSVNKELIISHTENRIVRCPSNFQRPPSRMTVSDSEYLVVQSEQSTPAQNQSKLNEIQLFADPMIISDPIESEPESIIQISVTQESVDSSHIAKLQIYTLMNNPPMGINGISPIRCDIFYNSTVRVIVDNGCSNGSIMTKRTGFEVRGIMSWSPVFSLPILSDSQAIVSCSFGVCKNKCDGSSCHRHPVEITGILNASTKIFLISLHDDVPDLVPKMIDVIHGFPPSNENGILDEVNTTTQRPSTNTGTANLPLIIALSVLVPIVCVLLLTTIWYRSQVNFGTYRENSGRNS